MSDTALLSLKVPSLRLLVLVMTVVFKTEIRISVQYLWCGTDRVAGKYYCTWCTTCPTVILYAINRTCIAPGSKTDLHGNTHSLIYALRAYLARNTQYSLAYLYPQSLPRKEHAVFTRLFMPSEPTSQGTRSIHSLIYTLRAYLARNTQYSLAYLCPQSLPRKEHAIFTRLFMPSEPTSQGTRNIHSLIYALRVYLARNTQYSLAYALSSICFLLVRDDLLTGCTNAYSVILFQ